MKLEIGYNHSFEIRKENYVAQNLTSFSVLFLADFHFNRFSNKTAQNIINSIKNLNPDIILLGGDYVDSKKGLIYFTLLMKSISERANVFAISGNHDEWVGTEKTQAIVEKNNGIWIQNKSIVICLKGSTITIDGNKPEAKQNTDFNILLLHKPINLTLYQKNYNLAFAGHLHGSQFVFWKCGEHLFPGRLFYKWNRLKVELSSLKYYISKGLGDTLPLRYNCKKDIIFISVLPT